MAETRQISQLLSLGSAAAQLPGGYLVVDVPNPAYDEGRPAGATNKPFVTRKVAFAELERLLAGGAATNAQRGTLKIVRFAFASSAGATATDSTLDRLPATVLCVGTRATVLRPTPQRWVLAAHPAGTLAVAPDGSFTGPLTAGRWVVDPGGAPARPDPVAFTDAVLVTVPAHPSSQVYTADGQRLEGSEQLVGDAIEYRFNHPQTGFIIFT